MRALCVLIGRACAIALIALIFFGKEKEFSNLSTGALLVMCACLIIQTRK